MRTAFYNCAPKYPSHPCQHLHARQHQDKGNPSATLSRPACLHAPPRKARANPKEPRLRQSPKQIGALHIKEDCTQRRQPPLASALTALSLLTSMVMQRTTSWMTVSSRHSSDSAGQESWPRPNSGRSEKFHCPRFGGSVFDTPVTACWCVKHTNSSSAQVSASTCHSPWVTLKATPAPRLRSWSPHQARTRVFRK